MGYPVRSFALGFKNGMSRRRSKGTPRLAPFETTFPSSSRSYTDLFDSSRDRRWRIWSTLVAGE